jgi:hypothetical protein
MSKKSKGFNNFIRNPKVVWYGPHQCNGCGGLIVRSSSQSGGISLNAPFNHHYPNHIWAEHKCSKLGNPEIP